MPNEKYCPTDQDSSRSRQKCTWLILKLGNSSQVLSATEKLHKTLFFSPFRKLGHDMWHEKYKWERIMPVREDVGACLLDEGRNTFRSYKEKQRMWSVLRFNRADEIALEGPRGGKGRAAVDRWGFQCAAFSSWYIHERLHLKKNLSVKNKKNFPKGKKGNYLIFTRDLSV